MRAATSLRVPRRRRQARPTGLASCRQGTHLRRLSSYALQVSETRSILSRGGRLSLAKIASGRESLTISPGADTLAPLHGSTPQGDIAAILSGFHSRRELVLENLALRQQLATVVLAEKSVRASPEPASCARLRHLPLVSVVKSSHLGELDHLPQLRPLDTPRPRGIAGE